MPQIVHLGARTGFVQELQMSHRQTWLILRDIVWGSLGVKLLGRARAFRRVTRLWRAVRPTLYERVASWLRARRGTARTGCRCAATRRSKHEIDHRWRPFRVRRVWETPR